MIIKIKIGGGTLKGRVLKIKKLAYHPVTGRAKTIIFDTLQFRMNNNPKILDCFSGSGILGVESLSRWGGTVTFIDNNKKAQENLITNLNELGIITKCDVYTKTVLVPPKAKAIADIIFLDPPSEHYYLIKDALKKLFKYGWIGDGTIIMIQTLNFQKILPLINMNIFKEYALGDSKISLYKYEQPIVDTIIPNIGSDIKI